MRSLEPELISLNEYIHHQLSFIFFIIEVVLKSILLLNESQ